MKHKVVLVDVMSTLVTEPFLTAMPGFFGLTLADLRRSVDDAAWIKFEKGLLSEAEFCASFFLDRRAVDVQALRKCLTSTYEWIDGMKSLMADLHGAQYSIHALSNYPVWYELIEQKLGLSELLEWTFVSCLTGLRKPNPRAYLGAAEQLQVAPSRCIFIDDRNENVEAARSVGMEAILMDDAEAVRSLLQRHRLLP